MVDIVNLLSDNVTRDHEYSTLKGFRSRLSQFNRHIDGHPIWQHPDVVIYIYISCEMNGGYVLVSIRIILFQRKAAIDDKTTYRELGRYVTRSKTYEDGYRLVESALVESKTVLVLL